MTSLFRWLAAVVLLAALTPMAAAQAAPGSGAYRIMLNPPMNASTGQYVSWSRNHAHAGQRVEVMSADGSVRSVKAVRKTGTNKRSAGRVQYRYVAAISGLTAATSYRYRIVTERGRTAWRTFHTAPPADGSFTFLSFGDTQNSNAGVPEAVIDAAVAKNPGARLLLQAGDVVNKPYVDREWSELSQALSPSAQSKNWLVSIGNHEQCHLVKNCRSEAGRGFRSYFQGATNGFASQRRTWFYVDHGPVRFVVLDPFGKDIGRQRAFAATALRDNPRPWSVVLMHVGPFAARGDRDNSKVRTFFLDVFEKYDADLVLTGHDHSYARGYKSGVAYLTSVSGPKYYDISTADWRRGGGTRVKAAYRTSTYQTVSVTPTTMVVRATIAHRAEGALPKLRTGRVLDQFVLTK